MQRLHADIVVIGGGLVGSAIAYGLALQGMSVVLLDEGDNAHRASRGNFGLVWVQGKGDRLPDYALWTRNSADLWPKFADALRESSDIDVGYTKPGGFALCMSDAEYEEREKLLSGMRRNTTGGYDFRMFEREELRQIMPQIGDRVVGASFCPHDGHVSPLLLLRALHRTILETVRYIPSATVRSVTSSGGAFRVEATDVEVTAPKVVLAAGLGNRELAPMVGLRAPVRPVKGQILVTEKVSRFLDNPTINVRQTTEGSVMMGDSFEEAGMNTITTPLVGRDIARRAVAQFPALEDAQLLRTWAALRIMTGDGYPIYEQSLSQPGAYVATCHSGVTLAAGHAMTLAAAIAEGTLPDTLNAFGAGRFEESNDIQAN